LSAAIANSAATATACSKGFIIEKTQTTVRFEKLVTRQESNSRIEKTADTRAPDIGSLTAGKAAT
jgi:hypothetical protein